MTPDSLNTNLDEHAIKSLIVMITPFLYLGGGAFIMLFFKSAIEEIVSGILFWWKSEIDKGEIIYLGEKDWWARVNHVGIINTDIYVYFWLGKAEPPDGGFDLRISNSELKKSLVMQLMDKIPVEEMRKMRFKP